MNLRKIKVSGKGVLIMKPLKSFLIVFIMVIPYVMQAETQQREVYIRNQSGQLVNYEVDAPYGYGFSMCYGIYEMRSGNDLDIYRPKPGEWCADKKLMIRAFVSFSGQRGCNTELTMNRIIEVIIKKSPTSESGLKCEIVRRQD